MIVLLALVIYCIYRFYKKKRINDKAEKNKKNFEDEEVLVFAEEEMDMLEEEASKVRFRFLEFYFLQIWREIHSFLLVILSFVKIWLHCTGRRFPLVIINP